MSSFYASRLSLVAVACGALCGVVGPAKIALAGPPLEVPSASGEPRPVAPAASALISAGAPELQAFPPPTSLALDEIEPGTIATAKTVFRGTEIEEVELEIVSIVRGIGPGQDMILAKGISEELERLGVAQGMSGSPVYVGDKLIGALSSTWSFSKEPFVGITPVLQMAREAAWGFAHEGQRAEAAAAAGLPSAGEDADDFLRSRAPASRPSSGFTPIGAPLVLSGFDRRLVPLATELFEPWGFTVTEGGTAGRAQRGGAIEPGATLGVRLAGGDVDMTAIGTVTWIEEDRVHAWGHPFFQMGEVEMPLVSGYVHSIIPSRLLSFKFASGAEIVGTALGDRRSGIFGRLGVEPRLIRFDLTVSRFDATETFHYDIVRNRQLGSTLVGLTAANSILSRGGTLSEETIRFRQRLVLEDGRETTVETLFAGERTIPQVVRILSDLTRLIANNPFEEVEVDRIEADIVYEPGIQAAFITSVSVDEDFPAPGDVLRGTYRLRDYRGEESRHRFEVPIPEDAREGRYLLLVGDARMAERFEAERDPRSFGPRTLDEYLERLATLRRTDQIHVHLYRSSPGVQIDGRPLPDLPPTAMSILRGPARSGKQDELPAEIVHEARLPADKFIQGGHTVLLEVRKENP